MSGRLARDDSQDSFEDEGIKGYRARQGRQARRIVTAGVLTIVVYMGALVEMGLRLIGHH